MSIEWFPTLALLSAAAGRPPGALAYAADTQSYHVRGAQWQPVPHFQALLKAALATAGPAGITLTVYCRLSLGAAEVEVPGNVTVVFADAGSLVFGVQGRLVLRGRLCAPPRLIFEYGGRGNQVLFTGSGKTALYPEWWGAIGDGVVDDSGPIQRCFDSPSLLDDANEIVFTSGKIYKITRTIVLGRRFDRSAKVWSFQIRGRGAMLRVADDSALDGPAVQIGHGAFARVVDTGVHLTFPIAELKVAPLAAGAATQDFPARGRVEWTLPGVGTFEFDYDGKTDRSLLKCTAAAGARVPTPGALLEHAQNVKLMDLDWQGLSITRRVLSGKIADTRGIGIALALCDWARFSHARVEGFASGIAYVEDGGNSNVFEQMRVSSCRTGAVIGGTPDGNGWRWIGGKVQQCEVGLQAAGATVSVADTDFSLCSTHAIRLDGVSEAHIKFYSEGVAVGTTGADGGDKLDAVLDMANCRAVVIEAARINGASGTYQANAAYGVRLRNCHGVRLSASLFTRHQYADVRIEADCSEVTVDADNQISTLVGGDNGKLTQANKLRVDDRTGGRIRDLMRLRDLPRRYGSASASATALNLMADPFLRDANRWQLVDADGMAAGTPAFAGTVLAPDGRSNASVVQLDTRLRLRPLPLPNLPPLTPNRTSVVLRYWWRAMPVRPGGAAARTPRALRAYVQIGVGAQSDMDWRRLDSAGVFTGAGSWQFEEIAFTPDRNATLGELWFTASENFGGEIDVALWGLQLFTTDDAQRHEPMVVP